MSKSRFNAAPKTNDLFEKVLLVMLGLSFGIAIVISALIRTSL